MTFFNFKLNQCGFIEPAAILPLSLLFMYLNLYTDFAI